MITFQLYALTTDGYSSHARIHVYREIHKCLAKTLSYGAGSIGEHEINEGKIQCKWNSLNQVEYKNK
jgi:hypothetical protein